MRLIRVTDGNDAETWYADIDAAKESVEKDHREDGIDLPALIELVELPDDRAKDIILALLCEEGLDSFIVKETALFTVLPPSEKLIFKKA